MAGVVVTGKELQVYEVSPEILWSPLPPSKIYMSEEGIGYLELGDEGDSLISSRQGEWAMVVYQPQEWAVVVYQPQELAVVVYHPLMASLSLRLHALEYKGPGRPRNHHQIRSSFLFDASCCEKYKWLPAGWVVEKRVRSNGRVDTFYYDPTGRQFRSKKTTKEYLETLGIIVNDGRQGKKRKPVTVNNGEGKKRKRVTANDGEGKIRKRVTVNDGEGKKRKRGALTLKNF